MSEHTTFLNLAATSLDWPLAPAEDAALSRHLDGCDACRTTAAGLRSDATGLRNLPRRSPSPHIAAVVARAARGETRTRPPLLMLSLGFLLLAGVAGAIVGGGALRQFLLDRQPPPTVVPSPAPTSAVVLPLPSAPAASIDPRLGVEWQIVRSASEGGSRSTSAWAVTAGGPGFVTVGRTCQAQPNVCWGGVQLSRDGSTWEEVPRTGGLEIGTYYPPSGPGADMIGVAARPDAIVAIGYAVDGGAINEGGALRPALWISPDGRNWGRVRPVDNRTFDGVRFSDIAATENGFVIVGADYSPRGGGPRGAIWTSNDGRAWQRVPDGALFDIGGYQVTGEDPGSGGPRRVVGSHGAIVSVGAVCNDKGIDCRPAFWSSKDGSTWQRDIVDEPNVTASDIVVTPTGFVAVGSASTAGGCGVGVRCNGIVFTSADGRTWQRHVMDVPDGVTVPDALTDAVAVGRRIIAIASDLDGQGLADGQARFWRSEDGLSWTPIDGIPPDLSPSPYQPLAAGQDRIVMVGDINARIVVSPKG